MKNYETALFEFIEKNVHTVLKNPIGFIKYPFIDPGSVYDGNVWDWDTYWSVYGLLNLADRFTDTSLKDKIIEHAKGNVRNFLDHQLEDGYIPMMIEVGKWPEPYLNMKHKEGILMNMHKPFLCSQITLISDYIQDYTWIAGAMKQLDLYFECYDKNYYFEHCGLYVWCDDIMIGMDNDPASFGRPKFSTANIFLNSFMVIELKNIAKILKECVPNDIEKAAYYEEKAKKLENAIQEEMYDKRDRFFYSVDVDIKTRSFDWFHQGLGVFWKTLPIKIRCWSGFLPLFAGIATKEQAKELVEHIFDEETFSSPYGIATLAKDEKMFDLSVTNNPSNWLGPIWLVANYAVFKGLLDYGYIKEAEEICNRSLLLLGKDLEKTGSIHEYYNPFDGEPIMNGGFINWNILVLNMVKELEQEKERKKV
jgi:glycogen debranching enzyme